MFILVNCSFKNDQLLFDVELFLLKYETTTDFQCLHAPETPSRRGTLDSIWTKDNFKLHRGLCQTLRNHCRMRL